MISKKNLGKKTLAAIAALATTASFVFQTGLNNQNNSIVKAADNDNYAKLLQQSLFLYDANMCGKTVENESLLTWRGNCHTSDEVDGGYHDAGDHAMFGLPQGFTAATLGWGYYEFKNSYDSLGMTDHFKTIMNHFIKFFKASTKLDGSGNVTNFLYQKGEGHEDHNYWGSPEKQTGNRKMYWTNSNGADIAAEYAAALAINYLNFGDKDDIKYAKALYSFSTRTNAVAVDGTTDFYKSSGCTDEQAWAAGWLYLATKEDYYKQECASKQTQYIGWIHGWDNVGLGAACVYSLITNNWDKVNGYIGSNTNGGYLFLDKWGSARLNTSMQFTALVAEKHSGKSYSNWCKGQMNYILGDNPARTCFVVGYASNSASKPHHRACSGTTTAEDDNTPSKYVLVGALVGGPTDQGGSYQDKRSDYVCNEVAIDYNAGFVGAAAGLYDKFKTGKTEGSIAGAKSNGVGAPKATEAPKTEAPKTDAPKTEAPKTDAPKTEAPKTNAPSSDGGYTLKVNKQVVYTKLPADDKMIGFKYEDFGIKAGEKVKKVEVNISASGNIGDWQGAFGSSTTVAPKYWTMTDEMSETFNSNSAKITWNVSAADTEIIQTGYNGEVKFGIWWITCDTFTIDSITVYTDKDGVGDKPVTTTAKPVTTTEKVTTKATTVTTKATTTEKGGSNDSPSKIKGDVDGNGSLTAADITAIMQALVGKKSLTSDQKTNADLDGDGKLSVIDLIKLNNLLLK